MSARERVAALTPSYFGFVMATGIVAIAAHMAGYGAASQSLSAVAVLGFVVLAGLNAWRIAAHGPAVRTDLRDHARAPGFFTWVAATAVVGAQFIVVSPRRDVATLAWVVALVLWVFFTYAIFASLTLKEAKPRLEDGLNGTWLLVVVATESIAVLSALLAMEAAPSGRAELHFLALATWLAGGMLYTWIVTLILYRYLFLRLAAADFTAPYWINMGAMAISALAGSLLITDSRDSPLLQSMRPFVEGVTILCWATATWWIPLLVVLVAWRYGHRRYPLRYEPAYWSAVFPLGMYSAATHELSHALALPFLRPVASGFLAAAALAWLAAFVAMVRAEARFSDAPAPPAR